ncbi:hypothetical protein RHSIM_Rhsim13G0160600 [Rhododendron simsii]|uniref:Uncharacterized protein n=1 Tax=Rhododendron simsii TaxID=118357 RepID=A0A834L6X4_RHOSS|nr:hypothetical protein RHSIM_Rhsim13G0160600 [Rhododendron simsii]
MSSNMQRQAVPLFRSEKCIVGTGLEHQAALDSGVLAIAKHEGKINFTNTDKIVLSGKCVGPVIKAAVQKAWDAFGTIDVLYQQSWCFSGKDGHVGVPEQTLVVPDRDPLRPGALLEHMSCSVNDAVSTLVGGNVAAAEEEAVGDVGRAGAGGEVVKAVGCVAGVGGENRQEGVEASRFLWVSFNFDENGDWERVKKQAVESADWKSGL